MTVSQAIKRAREVLDKVPERDVDSAWIVCFVCALSRSELHFCKDKELTPAQANELEEILARRATREPLQYIFGSVPFYNIELKTDARALIPRDETACIAEKTIGIIQQKKYSSVLDIGTGSGAIAIAIAKNCDCRVCALDISEEALSLARENADKNEVELEFIKSDLFSEVKNRRFDVIISNPPYVATRELDKLERELSFEPQNALDGGADGLDFYREIISEAKEHLNEGGLLVLEIGFDQAAAIKTLLTGAGFTNFTVEKDYSGLDREVYCFN